MQGKTKTKCSEELWKSGGAERGQNAEGSKDKPKAKKEVDGKEEKETGAIRWTPLKWKPFSAVLVPILMLTQC